ncbi:DUF7507 domain-containing protein [Demequina aurantiaca]|uniref:DUF7507 domain-containing protein n=1 Tax=Demequina aurantiaca TaxID=676200 RepID=UPI003D348287
MSLSLSRLRHVAAVTIGAVIASTAAVGLAAPAQAADAPAEDLETSIRIELQGFGANPVGDLMVGDVVRYDILFLNRATTGIFLFGDGIYGALDLNPGSRATTEGQWHEVTEADAAAGKVLWEGRTFHWILSLDNSFGDKTVEAPVVPVTPLRNTVSWDVDAVLEDSNGDGIGQHGDRVKVTWTATLPLDADHPMTIAGVSEAGHFAAVGNAFDGALLAPGAVVTHTQTLAVDTAWIASGALDYSATLNYSGPTDFVPRAVSDPADAVVLGEFVAAPVAIGIVNRFDDANADGAASIGESVFFDVTVTNKGTYPLTGLTLGDAAGATLDPAVLAVDALAPGASFAWTQERVVSAADFAHGAVTFAPTVAATGMAVLTEESTVSPLTFAAYESDLDAMAGGGVSLCSSAGEPVTSVAQGSSVTVALDGCAGSALDADARIVAFSTPVMLGTGPAAVVIPASLEAGQHRIAVYYADGSLAGWAAFTVTGVVVPAAAVETIPAASGGELAETGPEDLQPMLWLAGLMVLLGVGGVVAARRN